MYNQLWNKRNIILGAIIIIIIVLLLFPIHIPFSISVTGKIVPGQQWLVARQADGSIISSVYNYSQNITENYAAYQVDRGDVFHFKSMPELKESNSITAGDTIGYIFSNMFYQELNRLEGALEVARANLEVVSSGEQETILNEARDRLLLAQERAEVQNEILKRQTRLFQDSLISREEYEITRGMTRISDLEAQVAQAQLFTVEIGEKPEITTRAKIQIIAVENELRTLHSRLSDYTLRAPLSGEINKVISPDTLLLVSDETRLVIMPIAWQYLNDVDTNLTFTIETNYARETSQGSIISKSDFMNMISGQQVFIALGLIDENSGNLPLNMMVECSLSGNSRSIWDYVLYFLKALI